MSSSGCTYEWSKLTGLQRSKALERRRQEILDLLPPNSVLLQEWTALTEARNDCVAAMVEEEIDTPKEKTLLQMLELLENSDALFFTKTESALRSSLVRAKAALRNWHVGYEERQKEKLAAAPPPPPPPGPPPPPLNMKKKVAKSQDKAQSSVILAKPASRNPLSSVSNVGDGPHSYVPTEKAPKKLDLVTGIQHAKLRKSGVLRSPGGTPHRKRKPVDAGLLSSALKRRFYNAHSPDPHSLHQSRGGAATPGSPGSPWDTEESSTNSLPLEPTAVPKMSALSE